MTYPLRLAAYGILHTAPEPPWDSLALLAAEAFEAPWAAIGLPDGERIWLKARAGWPTDELPGAPGLCQAALETEGVLVLEDTLQDPVARHHPLVGGSDPVRFYAGIALRSGRGAALGTLCVMDRVPRHAGEQQLATLQRLAGLAEALLHGRLLQARLERQIGHRRALAEAVPQMLWTATPEGVVDSMSEEFRGLTGIGQVDIQSGGWLRGLHPDDRGPTLERWAACVADGRPYSVEFRIWHAATDEYRWHLVQARPAHDAAGRIVKWYGSSIDIHDRKRAEERLQRSEERLRTVLDTQPECVKVLSAAGLLLDINPAGVAMLEAESPELLMGRPVADFIHSADREAFFALHRQAIAGGTAQGVFRLRGLKGTERWIESRVAPLKLADGHAAVLEVTRDVTERLRAEAALAEAQQRNALILASTAEGIHGVDAQGRLIFINASALRMLGYEEAEVLGRDAHALFHQRPGRGDGRRPERRPLFLTLGDGRSRQVEGESLFRRDGSAFPVEYTVAAMVDERTGATAGAVVSFRDVTAKKRHGELRALEARVLERVSAGAALADVLEEVVRTVDRLLPPVRASIHVMRDGQLWMGAAPHLPEGYNRMADGIPAAEGVGSCGTAAFRRRQVIVSDIATDPLWQDVRETALQYGLRACWSTPVLDAQGHVLGTFAMYYGSPRSPEPEEQEFIARITQYLRMAIERTRQQERLQSSERRYRSLYELVPVAILEQDWSQLFSALAGLRAQGIADYARYFEEHPNFVPGALRGIRTLNVNGAALRIFGAWHPAELVQTLHEAGPGGLLHTLGRHLPALAASNGTFETELDLLTVDGRPLRVWLTMALPAPGDDSGRTLLSLLDITGRKEAEERFRTVAQATSDVVWDWNLRTDATWWNDGYSTVFGHPRGGAAADSQSWTAHIHPQDRQRVIDGVRQLIEGGGTRWRDEYRFARADGSHVQVTHQAIVLRDDAGHPVRMVGSLVDVTDRRLLEEQLRQSQRLDAVGQLTGGVAHDFNNLLTVILGNAELLADDLGEEHGLRALAEMIVTAAQRGAELASQLLAFARRQPLNPKTIDIDDQLTRMDKLLARTLGEHVEVAVVRAPGLWKALIDPGQLENAILNLCINARDAMPEGGKLTLETANVRLDASYAAHQPEVEAGEYVMVSVTDTGSGMDEATLKRAFDPFFTTKEPGKGSGLGLSMVYGFAKQSRGHVRIYSEPGHGTSVRLYLPRAQPAQAPEPPAEAPAPAVGGSETILLVEDNELVRGHVSGQLERLGYRVRAVADGPQALQELERSAEVDLLFTDVVMPGGLSGPQLAREVRRRHGGLPVLFTSGYTEHAMVHQGRLEPGVHLLAKPYRKQDLAAKVREVLQETRDA